MISSKFGIFNTRTHFIHIIRFIQLFSTLVGAFRFEMNKGEPNWRIRKIKWNESYAEAMKMRAWKLLKSNRKERGRVISWYNIISW